MRVYRKRGVYYNMKRKRERDCVERKFVCSEGDSQKAPPCSKRESSCEQGKKMGQDKVLAQR